tara:strand:+ start:577 stop:1506 length:930 start_codon:yes stop_codon:yes gene_type:complete
MSIYELLKIERPTVKESSLNIYMDSLRKAYHGIEGENIVPNSLSFLMKTDKVNEYLNQLKTDNTRKAYMNHIVVFLLLLNKIAPNPDIDVFIKDLRDRVEILNLNYVKFNKTNVKTEKQEKNWLSVSEIIAIAESLKKHNFQAYACIMIHLHIPMRNDLPTLIKMTHRQYEKLPFEEKRVTNAIVEMSYRNYEIRMNDYKTNHSYKETIIVIPKALIPIIVKLIKTIDTNNDTKYLIVNPNNGEPMKKNQYTKYLNKIFKHTGKKISSSLLRNIVLSEKYGKTVKEMKEMANNMMHSEEMQRSYIKCES